MDPFAKISEEEWRSAAGCVVAVDKSGERGIVAKGKTYEEAMANLDQLGPSERCACTFLAVPTFNDVNEFYKSTVGAHGN